AGTDGGGRSAEDRPDAGDGDRGKSAAPDTGVGGGAEPTLASALPSGPTFDAGLDDLLAGTGGDAPVEPPPPLLDPNGDAQPRRRRPRPGNPPMPPAPAGGAHEEVREVLDRYRDGLRHSLDDPTAPEDPETER
ncbi:MAG: hypothetical protein AAGD35_09555, partial [Actinomycetota bacterium]